MCSLCNYLLPFKNLSFSFVYYFLMYWIVPNFYCPTQLYNYQEIQPAVKIQEPIAQNVQGSHQYEWNPNAAFKVVFKKQLQIRQERKPKKLWSPEEDRILLKLRGEGKSWEYICTFIQNGSQIKCKRRHERLIKEAQKWPTQINIAIKKLHEQHQLSWGQIREHIIERFSRSYTLKSIRQRYINSLRDGIDKNPWTFEEDLNLLGILCHYGRQWQIVSTYFPSRSQRHIKNRFSCTLEPVLNKIRRRKCFKQLGEAMQNLIRPT